MLKWIKRIFSYQNDWHAVVQGGGNRSDFINAPATFSPLRMRKRTPDGNWIYRDPTESEIQDYLASEAW